jgi:glycosyltransferase involved in cell wall biosynthesis
MSIMDDWNYPLVTIGLTTYNRPDFLRESVNSVLNQTYQNFKLLIGNDYPETKITFKSLGIEFDERIEIFNFEKNIGEINNLNFLLNKSDKGWFTWLADDDIFHESFLESLIKSSVRLDEKIVAVYCPYISGEIPGKEFFTQKLSNISTQLNAVDFISKYLSKKFKIVGCYGLMDSEKLKEIGGFPSLGPFEGSYADTLIPILLSPHGDLIILNDPLVFYRTHIESYSSWVADLNHYTSAEPDCLNKITEVLERTVSIREKNKFIYLMVRWFTENEFAVLFRVKPGSKPLIFIEKLSLLLGLLIYQLKFNYPRIKFRYWIAHTVHIIKLITGFFFH